MNIRKMFLAASLAVAVAMLAAMSGCILSNKDYVTTPGGGIGDGPSTEFKLLVAAPEGSRVGGKVRIQGTLDPLYDVNNTEARHDFSTIGNDGKMVSVTMTVRSNYGYTAAFWFEQDDGTFRRSLDFTVNGTAAKQYVQPYQNMILAIVNVGLDGTLIQTDNSARLVQVTIKYTGKEPGNSRLNESVSSTAPPLLKTTWTWPDEVTFTSLGGTWNASDSSWSAPTTILRGESTWVAIKGPDGSDRTSGVYMNSGGNTQLVNMYTFPGTTYRVFQPFVNTAGVISQGPDNRNVTVTLH